MLYTNNYLFFLFTTQFLKEIYFNIFYFSWFVSFIAAAAYRWNVFRARLFRESCVYHRGNYVKDLNKLGRDLETIVIVDNSPASYIFHPDNAVNFFVFFLNKTTLEHTMLLLRK